MGVVDWLITVPGDGNTVRAGRKQSAIAGALTLAALRQSLGFGGCLIKVSTLCKIHLLMTGRIRGSHPAAVRVRRRRSQTQACQCAYHGDPN